MKQSDMIWMCLPQGLEELFEIVRFERTEQAYDIWLDEKKERAKEDRHNPNIVAKGYTDYVAIQDYPLRGRPVYLHMRKNKWLDKLSGKIFSYDLELPNENGTRLSAEFVSFLKDEGRNDGTVD
jgi:hypothetical protein